MNNDMTYNMLNNTGVQNSSLSFSGHANLSNMQNVKENNIEKTADSRECLGTLGYAQVQMDKTPKSVRDSLVAFLANPDKIEAQIDFEDELVECGYTLEDAVGIGDSVFYALSRKETY